MQETEEIFYLRRQLEYKLPPVDHIGASMFVLISGIILILILCSCVCCSDSYDNVDVDNVNFLYHNIINILSIILSIISTIFIAGKLYEDHTFDIYTENQRQSIITYYSIGIFSILYIGYFCFIMLIGYFFQKEEKINTTRDIVIPHRSSSDEFVSGNSGQRINNIPNELEMVEIPITQTAVICNQDSNINVKLAMIVE